LQGISFYHCAVAVAPTQFARSDGSKRQPFSALQLVPFAQLGGLNVVGRHRSALHSPALRRHPLSDAPSVHDPSGQGAERVALDQSIQSHRGQFQLPTSPQASLFGASARVADCADRLEQVFADAEPSHMEYYDKLNASAGHIFVGATLPSPSLERSALLCGSHTEYPAADRSVVAQHAVLSYHLSSVLARAQEQIPRWNLQCRRLCGGNSYVSRTLGGCPPESGRP
jgi:hypothetical protein